MKGSEGLRVVQATDISPDERRQALANRLEDEIEMMLAMQEYRDASSPTEASAAFKRARRVYTKLLDLVYGEVPR